MELTREDVFVSVFGLVLWSLPFFPAVQMLALLLLQLLRNKGNRRRNFVTEHNHNPEATPQIPPRTPPFRTPRDSVSVAPAPSGQCWSGEMTSRCKDASNLSPFLQREGGLVPLSAKVCIAFFVGTWVHE